MVARLTENIRRALEGLPLRNYYGWLDSTVALYWIKGKGSYKQFVSNRVADIQSKNYITWGHVSTAKNSADLGSRGCYGDQLHGQWINGPEWLRRPHDWPEQNALESSKESEVTKIKPEGAFDKLVAKHTFGRQ